ncbi:hypothetical protein OAO87_03815 [bacterium]|nr:hypothetical protein [bacterium]
MLSSLVLNPNAGSTCWSCLELNPNAPMGWAADAFGFRVLLAQGSVRAHLASNATPSPHWDALLTRFAVESRLHRTYALIQTQTPSQRPIGVLAFLFTHATLCLQGGGVLIWAGDVSFLSCNIYSNAASGVSAPPLPHWGARFRGTLAVSRREPVSPSTVATLRSATLTSTTIELLM